MVRGIVGAGVEQVWDVLGDLRRWPEWNPEVGKVWLAGPAGLGVRGGYVPRRRLPGAVHRRLAAPFVVTAYVPGREVELTQPEPFGEMRVRWTLRARDEGTEVDQRITFSGRSAGVALRVVGTLLERDARISLARLARLAGVRPGPEAPTVVIAGGSGALGCQVASDLVCRGVDVTILTRRADPALPFRQREWDGRTVGDWIAVLDNPRPTSIVNLAGKLVDCRPTARNIAELRRSRVDSTRALVDASARLTQPIEHWVQASTTAIWSDAGETRCDETTPLPVGLPQMTGVAEPWERAVAGANSRNHIVLRTSIVLDPAAPALHRLCQLTAAGLGGRVGAGTQWFSWIHIDDWLAIVRAGLGLDPTVVLPDGVVIAAAGNPVRNAELMRTLRARLHRPPAPPTPGWLLRLGAMVLGTDPALALTGRHATSKVLRHSGFHFQYHTLDTALADLLPR